MHKVTEIQQRYSEEAFRRAGKEIYPYKKIEFSKLNKADFKSLPSIWAIEKEGEVFEFFIHHTANCREAVLFGTGNTPIGTPNPNFNRFSWGSFLPCTIICFNDPTIYETELTIAWGYGRRDRWFQYDIAIILKAILYRLGIDERQCLCFGSSGGGTTAILTAAMLGCRATAINPQLNALHYVPICIEKFKKIVAKSDAEILEERLNLISFLQNSPLAQPRKGDPWLHLIINDQSHADVEVQLKPFMARLKELGMDDSFVRVDMYSAEGGHNTMPLREDCIRWIEEDLPSKSWKDDAVDNCRQFLDENYFFIDSNNFSSVKSKVYGFALTEKYLYHNYLLPDDHPCDIRPETDSGAYIVVRNEKDAVTILQDFRGCIGIYCYQREGYWAISNSLWLLQDKLAARELTLDPDYISDFAVCGCAPWLENRTPYREISLISPDVRIVIEKQTGRLHFEDASWQGYHSISLDDPRCLEVIDRWISKWTGIIRFLHKKKFHLSVDLTGGFDSRTVFALFLKSGVPLKDINIVSVKSAENDYAIAKQISETFDFPLNENSLFESTTCSPNLTLESYRNCYFGIHKSTSIFQTNMANMPVFKFSGQGGEAIRGAWHISFDEFLDRYVYSASTWQLLPFFSGKAIIEAAGNIQKRFGIDGDKQHEIMELLYLKGRSRNHHGKSIASQNSHKVLVTSPLYDPMLLSISTADNERIKPDTLYAMILCRTCKKLLDIPYEGQRHFSREALDYCKNIDELHIEQENLHQFGYVTSYHFRAMPAARGKVPLKAERFIDAYFPRKTELLSRHLLGNDVFTSNMAGNRANINKLTAIALAFAYYRTHAKNLPAQGGFLDADFRFDEAQWQARLKALPGAAEYFPREKAITALRETLALMPNLLAPRLPLALLLKAEGRTAEAESLLREALSLPTDDHWALLIKSKIATELKVFDKALEYARESFTRNNNITCAGHIARLLQQNGLYEEAIHFITSQLEVWPTWIQGFSVRYNCYFKLKLFDKAVADAESLLKLQESDPNYARMVTCLYEMKNIKEASRFFIEGSDKFGRLTIRQDIKDRLDAYSMDKRSATT